MADGKRVRREEHDIGILSAIRRDGGRRTGGCCSRPVEVGSGREPLAYATARVTAAGDSGGGPLFVEGSHQLVGVAEPMSEAPHPANMVAVPPALRRPAPPVRGRSCSRDSQAGR